MQLSLSRTRQLVLATVAALVGAYTWAMLQAGAAHAQADASVTNAVNAGASSMTDTIKGLVPVILLVALAFVAIKVGKRLLAKI